MTMHKSWKRIFSTIIMLYYTFKAVSKASYSEYHLRTDRSINWARTYMNFFEMLSSIFFFTFSKDEMFHKVIRSLEIQLQREKDGGCARYIPSN